MFALDARFLGLAEGASVSTWADRSGSGKQVSQTGTARPTLQGNWVVFDGVNDEMLGSDSGFPTSDYFCSLAAKCELSLSNPDYEPVMGYGTATTGAAVVFSYATDISFGTNAIGISQWGDSFGIASSTGSKLIYQSRRSGTSYLHSRNGGTETSKTMTTSTALKGTDGLFLGSFGTLLAGYHLNGQIGGMTLFSYIPAAPTRNRIAHSQAISFKLPFA
jgi:hypothetical protein